MRLRSAAVPWISPPPRLEFCKREAASALLNKRLRPRFLQQTPGTLQTRLISRPVSGSLSSGTPSTPWTGHIKAKMAASKAPPLSLNRSRKTAVIPSVIPESIGAPSGSLAHSVIQ